MVSKKTLRRYIKKLDEVILTGDATMAEELQNELLAVLGSDLDGLKSGLTNYSPIGMVSYGGATFSPQSSVDFIKDARTLRSRLQVELEKIEPVEKIEIDYRIMDAPEKPHKIFISHSTKDADYVEAIVSLLETLGLHEDEIICSSIPPYCIPLDHNVYDWLVKEFQHSDLHVFYALSEDYYNSAASLNEMGAAWSMKHKWTGILLPGFDFDQIDGCIDRLQISIKLDDHDQRTLTFRLDELKNNLTTEFGLRQMNDTIWNRKRDEFLSRIESITENRPRDVEESSVDEEYHIPGVHFEFTPISPAACVMLFYAAIDNGEIRINTTLSVGTSYQAGKNPLNIDFSPREEAKWESAKDQLVQAGYIKNIFTGKSDKVFRVTDLGYDINDRFKEDTGYDGSIAPGEMLNELIQ